MVIVTHIEPIAEIITKNFHEINIDLEQTREHLFYLTWESTTTSSQQSLPIME